MDKEVKDSTKQPTFSPSSVYGVEVTLDFMIFNILPRSGMTQSPHGLLPYLLILIRLELSQAHPA